MPGHPFCSVGDSVTDVEHKEQKYTRKVDHNTLQPLNPPQPKLKTTNVGRPTKEKKLECLKGFPQTGPLEEHPYMEFLAGKWEDAEAQIEAWKKKQDELKMAAHEFTKSYPQNIEEHSEKSA